MRDYQIPITLSALQVYHSGVVTMPECALRRHATESPRTARLILARDRDWETQTVVLEGHRNYVNSVAFSSNRSYIVSGSNDGKVCIWDAVSSVAQHILEGHTGCVTSVAYSPDGSLIVSGSYDCTVRIWDAVSGVAQHTLEGHRGSVTSVAYSPDGSRIMSGCDDGTVLIWDADARAAQHILGLFPLACSPFRNGLCSYLVRHLHCSS
jgi:WD40 repeat protein